MEHYEFVKNLIGYVSPVGETNEDNRRYENLKVMTELTELLISDINSIYNDNKDRGEFSMKRSSEFAKKFLDDLKVFGKVRAIKFKDPVLNSEFKVEISDLYTIISIGKRSYYFNLDGSFDGTSQDCEPIIKD